MNRIDYVSERTYEGEAVRKHNFVNYSYLFICRSKQNINPSKKMLVSLLQQQSIFLFEIFLSKRD
jgi:hypothetical protein